MDNDPLEQLLDWMRNRHFGKYRGTVIDSDDRTERGRLKVRVPAVLGELEIWAMPCVPYAGDKVGFFFLPEPGTGVWVEFEAGDPSFPIWSGFFWGDEQLPADATASTSKVIRTEQTTMVLNDETPEVRTAVDESGAVTIGDEVVVARGDAQVKVTTSSITSEIGSGKVAVEQSSVSINDGALEVT